MNIIDFWNRSWYIINWSINISMQELTKKYKENEAMKKRYFVIKAKKEKWYDLTHAERLLLFKSKDIIWEKI